MTDAMEDITLDDLTGPTVDQGGGSYELYIGDEAPDHDPFADYETAPAEQPPVPSAFGVPMEATTRLAHNLDVRRQKIWACWGSSVQVGWVGDAAHQAECSDHNRDASGTVHAIDPMVTGARAQAIVDQCLAHPGDLQYIIHNRTIWSATVGWAARRYTGSDPHTDHVHVSGKHGTSNRSSATCTGYDRASEAVTPVFDICPAPKPPAPKPPVKPGTHAPGTRTLEYLPHLMSGDDVLFVQRFIGSPCGKADGKFGPKTAEGVRWYRKMRNMRAVGVVDEATWKQMGVKWRG